MEMHMSRGQIPVCIRISPYTHDTFAVGGNYGTTCVVNVQIGAKIYCSLPKHFRSSVCTLAFGDEVYCSHNLDNDDKMFSLGQAAVCWL